MNYQARLLVLRADFGKLDREAFAPQMERPQPCASAPGEPCDPVRPPSGVLLRLTGETE